MFRRYAHWLHTRWPAGTVETLPVVSPEGATNVPGLLIAGDLNGIPLLKFASDSGARAVRTILSDPAFQRRDPTIDLDLVIIGAGVAGVAAAIDARAAGLRFEILEASAPFSTLVNFPRGKPIYTYPTGMTPLGSLLFTQRSSVKEGLVEEMTELAERHGIRPRLARAESVRRRGGLLAVALAGGETLLAHRVIVAIGRSGEFRRLGVPGESLDTVTNRLHDPKDYAGQDVVVVGGGDSAAETAVAVARAGGRVTLSYRRAELSRPKPAVREELERLARPGVRAAGEDAGDGAGLIRLALGTEVVAIRPGSVTLRGSDGSRHDVPASAVLVMIGRAAPLDFLRRCGVRLRGEFGVLTWATFAAFLLLCTFLYNWKAGASVSHLFEARGWFPYNLPGALSAWDDPATLRGTVRLSIGSPGFWYALAYTVCVTVFGWARIRRRRTPYITAQTLALMAIQIVPLFLLPYVVLPWAGHNGWFDSGSMAWLGDHLFPRTEWDPHGREYWRAFGLVLAWPLFIWNVFTSQPMWLWLGISVAQTFVLIPLMVYVWGKGAYCGWICSCGALAETLGDTHRHKMPHGRFWNALNMTGQVVLAFALLLLVTRIAGWIRPDGLMARMHDGLLRQWPISYYWGVDVLLAGILGVGCYFWFSGRVWCRFACPLAALMHIYARFSRFRILSDKKRCISCNACTAVCHQGIDVMSFANKGEPMDDPECVRCSACVQTCPTGTLTFGQIEPSTGRVLSEDRLAASPVLRIERKAAPAAPVKV